MSFRIAIAGFRHGHIMSLVESAREMEGVEVVAACEEDAATREAVNAAGRVSVAHDDFPAMLAQVPCDAVAIGDYYARRGPLAIAALSAGRHVISDKPLCTSLDQLDEIERLAAEKGLRVGCMLNMRDAPRSLETRRLIGDGLLGDIQAIAFGGQHPLSRGSRPAWYFEPGCHGGTINDIAVHAIDLIPWLTGLDFSVVNAARNWNAFVPEHPHFRDAAQLMLTMNNGCGVLGDVSYFAPDSHGYRLPFYWRLTFYGRRGILESSSRSRSLSLAIDGEKEMREHPLPDQGRPGGYLADFLADVRGRTAPGALDTAAVLRAARVVLTIQAAADSGTREVPLPAAAASGRTP